MVLDYSKESFSEEKLTKYVKESINILIQNQRSQTMILSSYKINTILRSVFGIKFRIDRIGRILARLAKQYEYRRLDTKIPKYQVSLSHFTGFSVSD